MNYMDDYEKIYDDLMDFSSELIIRVDRQFKIIFVSSSIKNYNLSKSSLLGKELATIIDKKEADFLYFQIQNLWNTNKNFKIEIPIIFNENICIDMLIRGKTFNLEDQPKSVVLFFQDITLKNLALDKLESLIQARTRKLRSLVEQLENEIKSRKKLENVLKETIKELTIATDAKSAFLANMSHEIRTPLNSIIGFNQILLDELKDKIQPDQLDLLRSAYQNGLHLRNLVNDVLDLEKIEKGMIELDFANIDLVKLINSIMKTFQVQSREKNIILKAEIPRENIYIKVDERRLKQILINIIGNAIKFTEKGSVLITLQLKENIIEIIVKDTGTGIPPEKFNQLFQPFIQLENYLTKQHEGTGLGLYYSKKLVNLLNGDIWFESEPNKGSTFHILLPRSNSL